jgi:uncharacterized RDD family membrane protein YckC
MNDLIQQGVNAFKSGDKQIARKYLTAAIKEFPDNERAWGWMYNVCGTDQERIHCLKQMIRINPNNEKTIALLNNLTNADFPLEPQPIRQTSPVSYQTNLPSYGVNTASLPSISYAGFWKRFLALIIDSILLAIIGAIVGGILGGIMGFMLGAAGVDLDTIRLFGELLGYIIGFLLNWLYFTILEASSNQGTLGKMALGIIVTDQNRNRISFGNANGRFFAKILSGIFFIGYIMAGFTEKKQALHDMLASTLVLNKS